MFFCLFWGGALEEKTVFNKKERKKGYFTKKMWGDSLHLSFYQLICYNILSLIVHDKILKAE